jgi:hypothetical protein
MTPEGLLPEFVFFFFLTSFHLMDHSKTHHNTHPSCGAFWVSSGKLFQRFLEENLENF